MLPLLLIKQTIQAFYIAAGALLLDGPHVQVTSVDQILSKVSDIISSKFSLSIEATNRAQHDEDITLNYAVEGKSLALESQEVIYEAKKVKLRRGLSEEHILRQNQEFKKLTTRYGGKLQVASMADYFLGVWALNNGEGVGQVFALGIEDAIVSMMHIPGLRTAPKRSYPAAAYQTGSIRGTFDAYTAGLILYWQQQKATESLAALTDALQRLGLTGAVEASTLNANELEVKVGRLPVGAKTRKKDLVNIADVGFGVSQVLPIVVALIAAEPGQLVYIEQPELHLHPRAQVQMAHLLAAAAKRGVRVIAETHSSLILLTVQTLVAEGTISPKEVSLNWFERVAKGATQITRAEVDENGAYGPWPEDFGDVELTAQGAYLDAGARRHAQPKPKA